MNRFKKEEQRKANDSHRNLLAEQIEKINNDDRINKELDELTRIIHIEKFPEEYDFMYDSIVDSNERKNGKNPMSEEYIESVRKKREQQGVSQLDSSGMAIQDDSLQLCRNEAKKQMKLLK